MQKKIVQNQFQRQANLKDQRDKDLTTLPWQNYFEHESYIKIDDDTFHTYSSGKTGPVCFFLHGAGFSALSWALLTKCLQRTVRCRCVCMDIRGHGTSTTQDDADLSATTLAKDVERVLTHTYTEEKPHIILVGHSMGGAIATRVAHNNLIANLLGLVVIDVVEGTALEALNSMQSFLQKRPSSFSSVQEAVQYCRKSGQIRNMESARVSVIGQLKAIEVKLPANQREAFSSHVCETNVIKEEADEEKDVDDVTDKYAHKHSHKQRKTHTDTQANTQKYTWRTDLTLTQPFWKGWFEGLSQMFINSHPPKMLLLAGMDRLDKSLTIAQMQGKFQLEVMRVCGHAVHEDCPDQVAEKLASFLIRYKLTTPTNSS